MNLLALVQAAAAEMGLVVPASVAGNSDRDVTQMLALMNSVGGELAREHEWQALCTEYRFTTQYSTGTGVLNSSTVVTGLTSTSGLDTTYMVNGTGINQDTYIQSVDSATQVTLTQPATLSGSYTLSFGKTKYAMPEDYDRQIDKTHYDKSKRWQMLGPETPQQWQFLKSSYISTGPRLRYRIMGGFFQIWPAVNTPEYLGFEYVSNAWVRSSTGAARSLFSADNDTCIFPDRLMILGLKRRYFEVKGFDASAYIRDFERQRSIAKANDAGSPTLSFAPSPTEILIGVENLPDTNYGL